MVFRVFGDSMGLVMLVLDFSSTRHILGFIHLLCVCVGLFLSVGYF